MSKYQTPPSWWQLVVVIRDLRRIAQQWEAGQVTNESAMRTVSDILKGMSHV